MGPLTPMVKPGHNGPGGRQLSLRPCRFAGPQALEAVGAGRRERKGVKAGEVVKRNARFRSLWLARLTSNRLGRNGQPDEAHCSASDDCR